MKNGVRRTYIDEFLLSLRRLPMIILAALLVIPTGCLAPGEEMVNISPEATASLAGPTSAPVTADPTLTTTQPPVVSPVEPPVVSPSATLRPGSVEPSVVSPSATLRTGSVEPPVEMATATPTADLPVAPVMGARAPDFTLTDLNGSEVSLSGLRGQPVLLNFWTTW